MVSIDPPEASVQASYCAQYYPLARDMALQAHVWDFTKTRVSLALLAENPTPQWLYSYARPEDMLHAISILAPDALDDDTLPPTWDRWQYAAQHLNNTVYNPLGQPQDFTQERNSLGQRIILTNQKDAVLRYTTRSIDASEYPPFFTSAVSHLLASYLAGALMKGDAGKKEGKAQLQLYASWLAEAKKLNAQDSRKSVQYTPRSVAVR